MTQPRPTDVDEPHDAGDVIVRANIGGTLVFVVTAVVAAVLFTDGVQWIAAVVAITLFFAGIAAFLWSFWNAVQRSRGEQVAVTQLYLLSGGVAPRSLRRLMLTLLGIQTVTGLATALARPDSADGSPGTSLALGVLDPDLGLGLNGMWAAFHATYDSHDDRIPRRRSSTTPHETGDTGATTARTIEKNEHHG